MLPHPGQDHAPCPILAVIMLHPRPILARIMPFLPILAVIMLLLVDGRG
jgi:hypothetical protein